MEYQEFQERYRDKQHIGQGGFGKVYKVFDQEKNHYVALKVSDVRPEISKFTLMNEVELVNKLPHHKNIARYDSCYRFNTGFTGEMDFAILTYYEHGNLDKFLKTNEVTLSDKDLLIKGVARGIEFLHQQHIIHRDLKSENVLIQREDGVWTPKVTDFGLSRMVNEADSIVNSAIGMSYAYAAPEQILNQKITSNVDIWAFGVIMYRVMADTLPFVGKSSSTNQQAQLELSQQIVNLELPEELSSIPEPYQAAIRRCLVLDPQERAQTATEILDILSGKSSSKSGDKPKTIPPPQKKKPSDESSQPTQIITPPGQDVSNPMSGGGPDSRPPGSLPPPESPVGPPIDEGPGGIDFPVYPPEPPQHPEQPPVEQPKVQQPASEKKSKTGLVVVAVVIGLCGIAGAVYFFGLKGPDQTAKVSASPVVVAPVDLTFAGYEAQIDAGDQEAIAEINRAADRHTKAYRPAFLKAYLAARREDDREAMKWIPEAFRRARDNGELEAFQEDFRASEERFSYYLDYFEPSEWGDMRGGAGK
jgi:serine/threonine protein kinase